MLFISLIISIAVMYFFYKAIDKYSYWQNTGIYFIYQVLYQFITSIGESDIQLLPTLIVCCISSLLSVLIMQFAKKNTSSIVGFVIVSWACSILTVFVINFILTLVLFNMFF